MYKNNAGEDIIQGTPVYMKKLQKCCPEQNVFSVVSFRKHYSELWSKDINSVVVSKKQNFKYADAYIESYNRTHAITLSLKFSFFALLVG